MVDYMTDGKQVKLRGRPKSPERQHLASGLTGLPTPDLEVGQVGQSPTKRPPMSAEQIRAALARIAELIQWPGGEVKARKEMRETYGWTAKRTNKYIEKVFGTWHKQDEASRKYDKARAIRRLESHIQAAREKNSVGGLQAIAAFEAQLAKIQGTEEPLTVKVDANLGPVVGAVLAGMSVEAMAALAREYDELQAKALPARVYEGEVIHAPTREEPSNP